MPQEESKKKERHIVTWSQEEDDILRNQISLHGTENWAVIASKFKDKTTRQCRRRWYTYLNSDFKKGGWSPEEDMLLCEAQKIFGNRWTEIAKVVSGRTDNAVKNRFSTLCKKRAKYEALAKENANSYINQNDKRVIMRNGFNTDGTTETTAPPKKMRRSHIPVLSKNCTSGDGLLEQCGKINQQLRPPFTVLIQNAHSVENLQDQHNGHSTKEVPGNAVQNSKFQGSFLKKDDPKIIALMQQAELLSSLALKVNSENTDQSLENAWMVLQDFLNQSKDSDILSYGIDDFDFQFEDLKYLLEDLRSTTEGSRPSWQQPDLYDDSPGSSEYSTGSTLLSQTECYQVEQNEVEIGSPNQEIRLGSHSIPIEGQNDVADCEKGIVSEKQEIFPSCDHEATKDYAVVSASSNTEFTSPIKVTPLFRSLAAGIPSPKFSESERNFLLKTLGEDSPCPIPCTNPSQPPPCKRSLLQSL